MKIPTKYIPKHLSKKDREKQRKNIINTRRLYSKQKYIQRPNLKTYKRKKSSHVSNAKELYKVPYLPVLILMYPLNMVL